MNSFTSLRNALLAFLFVATFGLNATAQSDLEKALYALPDVIFHEIDPPKGFEAAYELRI